MIFFNQFQRSAGGHMETAKKELNIRELILIALFAALTAIGAFIKIPIPYISFSLQTLFVSMSGMLLGAKAGAITMAVYIIIGFLGFPIFTMGGGIGYLLQPSCGYLFGFLLYSALTGYFTRKLKTLSFKNLYLAQIPGLLAMYAAALPYFYFISNYYTDNPISVSALFLYCFLALMPGEAAKCAAAAALGKRLIPALRIHKA